MSDHIQAKSITLVDDDGVPRIHLHAGGPEGHASVGIWSDTGKNIEISSQPSGDLAISFAGTPYAGMLSISERGMVIRDSGGRLGITIGRFDTGENQIVVYRDGQPAWRSPA